MGRGVAEEADCRIDKIVFQTSSMIPVVYEPDFRRDRVVVFVGWVNGYEPERSFGCLEEEGGRADILGEYDGLFWIIHRFLFKKPLIELLIFLFRGVRSTRFGEGVCFVIMPVLAPGAETPMPNPMGEASPIDQGPAHLTPRCDELGATILAAV